MKGIKVIYVKPGMEPETVTIENSSEKLRGMVGGYLQAVFPYDDPVAIVCNEEGKLKGLAPNRALTDREGKIYDILHGNFLIVGVGDEDFESLPENLIRKYTEKFRAPEIFVKTEHGISAVRLC